MIWNKCNVFRKRMAFFFHFAVLWIFIRILRLPLETFQRLLNLLYLPNHLPFFNEFDFFVHAFVLFSGLFLAELLFGFTELLEFCLADVFGKAFAV